MKWFANPGPAVITLVSASLVIFLLYPITKDNSEIIISVPLQNEVPKLNLEVSLPNKGDTKKTEKPIFRGAGNPTDSINNLIKISTSNNSLLIIQYDDLERIYKVFEGGKIILEKESKGFAREPNSSRRSTKITLPKGSYQVTASFLGRTQLNKNIIIE